MTPSPAAVRHGQSLTFTSNQPVAWSLAKGSSGSLKVTSSTSATYTAPATVAPQGISGGCQTTPNDSVFNTRIDRLPVEARSAQWIATMNANGLYIQPDFGMNVLNSTTPYSSDRFLYTSQNNGLFPHPAPETEKRQLGAYQTDLVKGSADKHVIAVDPTSCTFYEMYKNYFSPCTCGSETCTATSGYSYAWSSYALPTGSTQASNLLYAPLMIKLPELQAGVINHALSFTEDLWAVNGMSYWPANSTLGKVSSGPPYGSRFRLKSTFDISTFSAAAQVVLRALQQYGMFLSDSSIGGAVLYADTDTTRDQATMSAFAELAAAKITMNEFDAVDESSFIVNTKSMQVNPLNPYQAPANFAVLNAAPAGKAAVSIPIALGSEVVGVASSRLFIIAGTPSYALQAFVGGSPSETVTWSLGKGMTTLDGTVTPNGIFTPPAAVSAPTNTVVQATNASESLSESVFITILPAGTNPAGSIRIDVGSKTNTTSDGGTKVWMADLAYEGASDQLKSDYKWTDQTNPEINIYQSFHYTEGDDLTYSLGVPNGNYRVRMMFGAPYNGHGCQAPPCSYDVLVYPRTWGPYNLIANGQVAAHNYDFGVSIGHHEATPVDAYIPAQVTNNQLTVSVRGNRPDWMAGYPEVQPVLEGLEILPDSTLPHLAIDTQQQTTVSAGHSLQLYAVGWYMSNAVTWSLVSGPGSVSATGVYVAPAIAPSKAEVVTLKATSITPNRASTTVQLTIPAA